MAIFTRYVLKEMIGPTLLGFTFYTSIILMQQLFDMAGLIIRRSLSAAVVGKLLLFSLPNIIVLTVPMSLLFGILIAVGRLSSDSEIVAMRALGISTRTIYRPVFLFSFADVPAEPLPDQLRDAARATRSSWRCAPSSPRRPPRKSSSRAFSTTEYENLMIYVNDVDPGHRPVERRLRRRQPRRRVPGCLVTPQEMSAQAHRAAGRGRASAALSQQGAGQRIIVAKQRQPRARSAGARRSG